MNINSPEGQIILSMISLVYFIICAVISYRFMQKNNISFDIFKFFEITLFISLFGFMIISGILLLGSISLRGFIVLLQGLSNEPLLLIPLGLILLIGTVIGTVIVITRYIQREKEVSKK